MIIRHVGVVLGSQYSEQLRKGVLSQPFTSCTRCRYSKYNNRSGAPKGTGSRFLPPRAFISNVVNILIRKYSEFGITATNTFRSYIRHCFKTVDVDGLTTLHKMFIGISFLNIGKWRHKFYISSHTISSISTATRPPTPHTHAHTYSLTHIYCKYIGLVKLTYFAK